METTVLDEIVKWSQASSPVLLMLGLIGVLRGWWVPRWVFDQHVAALTAQKEEYKAMVRELHEVFNRAVGG